MNNDNGSAAWLGGMVVPANTREAAVVVFGGTSISGSHDPGMPT